MVVRTGLNATLYVHCLSCWNILSALLMGLYIWNIFSPFCMRFQNWKAYVSQNLIRTSIFLTYCRQVKFVLVLN